MRSTKGDSKISTPLSYPDSEQLENKTRSKYWGQNITFTKLEARSKVWTLDLLAKLAVQLGIRSRLNHLVPRNTGLGPAFPHHDWGPGWAELGMFIQERKAKLSQTSPVFLPNFSICKLLHFPQGWGVEWIKEREGWRVPGENPSLRTQGVGEKKKEFPSNSNTKCNWLL